MLQFHQIIHSKHLARACCRLSFRKHGTWICPRPPANIMHDDLGVQRPLGRSNLVTRMTTIYFVKILAARAQVVSSKNPKTIIVAFHSYSEHPLYRKRVRKTSRIVAHDEANLAGLGDYVSITPCVPVSKTKRFKLDRVIKKYEYAVDETTGCVLRLCLSRLYQFGRT